MKFVILLSILYVHLTANSAKLFELYQKGSYHEACTYGYRFFAPNQSNESYVSLVGFSCLKADQIDKLSPVMSALSQSAEARANSAYFSLLVMQKKLLMQALYDNKPITNLQFPKSAHILSKVFDLYIKNPQNSATIKEYKDPLNARQSYTLYTTETNGQKSIAIDEYYDKILTFHHVF